MSIAEINSNSHSWIQTLALLGLFSNGQTLTFLSIDTQERFQNIFLSEIYVEFRSYYCHKNEKTSWFEIFVFSNNIVQIIFFLIKRTDINYSVKNNSKPNFSYKEQYKNV